MTAGLPVAGYRPGRSLLHRLGPGVKLLVLIAGSVAIFRWGSPLGIAIAAVVVLTLYTVAMIPPRVAVAQLWPLRWPVLAIAVLQTAISGPWPAARTCLTLLLVVALGVGLLSGGFHQSIRLILDGMLFDPRAEIRTSQEVAVATAPIDSPAGVIESGQVAGQRFCWDAVVDDEPVVRVAVNWLMGTEHLEPAWTLGDAGERYEIELKGDPDLFVTLKGMQPETPEEGWVRNPGRADQIPALHAWLRGDLPSDPQLELPALAA